MRCAIVLMLVGLPLGAAADVPPSPPAAPAPATTAQAAAAPKAVLPFIEDDYPRALAEARRRQLPLFVDSWAPW
jgi:hypothetical protein